MYSTQKALRTGSAKVQSKRSVLLLPPFPPSNPSLLKMHLLQRKTTDASLQTRHNCSLQQTRCGPITRPHNSSTTTSIAVAKHDPVCLQPNARQEAARAGVRTSRRHSLVCCAAPDANVAVQESLQGRVPSVQQREVVILLCRKREDSVGIAHLLTQSISLTSFTLCCAGMQTTSAKAPSLRQQA